MYEAMTAPVRVSTTRAPWARAATNSRPWPSSLSPTDGVPGPAEMISPAPVRRSAR